jgi:hypothetical protein
MCGAVRYQVAGTPFGIGYCHCASCRRHTGAPVVMLAGYRKDQVTFAGAVRQVYESSPGVGRAFCGGCGTPLTWEGMGGTLGAIFEIHIGTFDDPAALVPQFHQHDGERLPWLDVADRLPRYHAGEGEGEPCFRDAGIERAPR